MSIVRTMRCRRTSKLIGLLTFSFLSLLMHAQSSSREAIDKLPYKAAKLTAHYGSAPQQVGELRLPDGPGPFPAVIVIHGGCLLSSMDSLAGTRALASAITDMGYATWNIEYRALDQNGGGWPGTYQDWSAATDYLKTLAKSLPIRTDDVVALGHSAGAPAALWLASRAKLATSSEVRGSSPLVLRGAVDIDGPAELQPYVGLDATICGQPIVKQLMGGTPDQQPSRYAQVTPSQMPATGTPQLLVASAVLPVPLAETFRDKVNGAAGALVTVLPVKDGGHFDVIAPGSRVWNEQVKPALQNFLASVMK